ncbi:CaiB/BaiF CoA transferase family protein [Corynebacterium tapiri]|uniref:CoA transferase n=1 Tax=Corynebacterium tapiri TaxID=1448266 RepID=A0A5C4U4X4_9CORY|nr:CaiB/BaiF CoA-transferase family protein [Corynebacterium tapiri]TNL99330.1 CoA transferase [Corynebacterium tapiri]
MTHEQGAGPLDGLVVADFSRVLAGPYCTMLLADMGATVIKVESPSGDETRTWKPPVYDDRSTYYLSINRNKKSIALDFGNPQQCRIAREIAAKADVVVENFKPGGLAKFGLDYESVRATNPSVIYSSVTGFGNAGGAGLPGYDLLVQASSGLMSLTGAPDSPAYRSGIAIFDVITGLHTAIGVLAALVERGKSGRGQHVESNLLSSALSGMVNQTAGYILSGRVPQRMGNQHPSIYPYEPLPTADGDLVVTIGNDRQFQRFCTLLGAEHLATDPRFALAADRSHNRADLRPLLVDLLATRPASEWFELLTQAGLPCAPINDIRGGIEFATDLGLDPVVQVGSGERTLPGIRNPLTFSETPVGYPHVPPEVDEHRAEILTWLSTSHPKEQQ